MEISDRDTKHVWSPCRTHLPFAIPLLPRLQPTLPWAAWALLAGSDHCPGEPRPQPSQHLRFRFYGMAQVYSLVDTVSLSLISVHLGIRTACWRGAFKSSKTKTPAQCTDYHSLNEPAALPTTPHSLCVNTVRFKEEELMFLTHEASHQGPAHTMTE